MPLRTANSILGSRFYSLYQS